MPVEYILWTDMFLQASFIFLLSLTVLGHAEIIDINLDGTPARPARRTIMLAMGTAYSLGSDLGFQPQLSSYLDLPHFWQGGLRTRISIADPHSLYDYFPQISLDFRKLWIGDEGKDPIRNAEYFSISLGGFLGYDFAGKRKGLSPLGALTLGKYWMPLEENPFGLDISLELSRLITGHIWNQTELVFITLGLSLFYVLP